MTVKQERKNRPGQKFGAKKKLWVWTWFIQDTNDHNTAACDFCGKVITRQRLDKGSPKKLLEHLKTHKLSRELINPLRGMSMGSNSPLYTANMGYNYSNSGMIPTMNQIESDVERQPSKFVQAPERPRNLSHSAENGATGLSSTGEHRERVGGSTIMHGLQNGHFMHGQAPHSVDLVALNPAQNQTPPVSVHNSASVQTTAPSAYGRRFVSPNFDNTPYSALKFHRHLLKFLADNKLLIRTLQLHSFQQLIYDLRPDSILDLMELAGLYSSFVEVSRVDGAQDASSDSFEKK